MIRLRTSTLPLSKTVELENKNKDNTSFNYLSTSYALLKTRDTLAHHV